MRQPAATRYSGLRDLRGREPGGAAPADPAPVRPLGLVSPTRTTGRNRLYSTRDIARLREVQRLAGDGVNLTGIIRILELEEHLDRLRRRLDALEARERSTALVVWRPERRR